MIRTLFKTLTKITTNTSTAVTVVGLVVISLIARIIYLMKASVWHDEGYSAMIINQPIGDIIAKTVNDVHPPFYYIVLNLWQSVFGPEVISLRGFSVVCGILTVVALYFLLRKLFNENIARLGGLFAAIGPFLVRYSDEMRMYSLSALLAVTSTLLLAYALTTKSNKRWALWIMYGLVVAAGMYTQYFFVFLVPVHVLYALYVHKWQIKKLVKDGGWWLGNLLAGGIFALWLPAMLAQMSRVQEGFWIPPMSIESIPNTISYFAVYSNLLTPIFGYFLLIGAIILPLILLKTKQLRANALLLAGWLVVPILLVTVLSINRPVYIDRYFVYSAPAFYALIAVIILSIKTSKKWLAPLLITVVCITFIFGIGAVGDAANHKMANGAQIVNQNFKKGDVIVSAELYTYFDFSYYNKTGESARLLLENPFGKYGEYSLLHDKPELRVASFSEINAPRVWVVGKTGEHDYFTSLVPGNWYPTATEYTGGDTAIRLYEIHN